MHQCNAQDYLGRLIVIYTENASAAIYHYKQVGAGTILDLYTASFMALVSELQSRQSHLIQNDFTPLTQIPHADGRAERTALRQVDFRSPKFRSCK